MKASGEALEKVASKRSQKIVGEELKKKKIKRIMKSLSFIT